MGKIYNNIVETVGHTPLVKLNRVTAGLPATVALKCEFFNPLGSVKDRIGMAMIEDAEQRGILKPETTIIEPTSGNTGIALAFVCAAKGYPFVATMVETFSIERRKIMKALGARVILTPAAERGSGMVARAEALAKQHGWFMTSQFENPANPAYHRNTTAPEILRDFAGHELDYFVSGWGTGGTMTGTGQVLKVARPGIKIIGVEPQEAALLSGNPWSPHKIQGWTPDFVPEILDPSVTDELVLVSDEESLETARDLARLEGIFCGISCGATMAGALKIAAEVAPGQTFCVMLPDTGERYLSTPLFEHLTEDSDDEWLAAQA